MEINMIRKLLLAALLAVTAPAFAQSPALSNVAKLRTIISITDPAFAGGAKCDGTTDDTNAIQAAVTYAGTVKGKVLVPYGTCITQQIALATGVAIEGQGFGSCLKLKAANNNYILANTNGGVYVDDVSITNLCLDGNKANNTGGGGVSIAGRNWTVSNVY